MRFPAHRFVWSALADLPEVGPLVGTESEGPTHWHLFEQLARDVGSRHGDENAIVTAGVFGSWLELRHGVYRLSADAGDGYRFEDLAARDRGRLTAALKRWAQERGARFIAS